MELFNYFWADLPGAPALTYSPGSLVEIFDTCLVNGMGLTVVQQITVAGGVATIEVAGAPVALEGGLVEIAGSGVAALNGIHRVEALGTNTITIHVSAADATLTEAGVTVRIPPLGWEVVHAAEHRRIYRSKSVRSNGLLLYVDDRAQGHVQIRLCEGADDIDTRHGEFGGSTVKTLDLPHEMPWMLLGDDRAVYIGLALRPKLYDSHQYLWSALAELTHGDAYSTALIRVKDTWSGALPNLAQPIELHKSRSGDAPAAVYRAAIPAASGISGMGGIDLDGRVWLCPVSVFSNGQYRGDLPGYRHIPHRFGADNFPALQDAVVTLDGRRFLIVVASLDGMSKGYCAFAIDDWRDA